MRQGPISILHYPLYLSRKRLDACVHLGSQIPAACMQAGVYSGLTGGVAYRGVPQSRVGYARLGLPALPPPEQASAAKVSLW